MKNQNIAVIVGLILTFVILGCNDANLRNGSRNTSSSSSNGDSTKRTSSEAKAEVSMETFKKLSTGMSEMDVVKILGRRGELISSNRIAGIRTEMYQWDGDVGDFGANMNIIFQDGELVSKTQFGLK